MIGGDPRLAGFVLSVIVVLSSFLCASCTEPKVSDVRAEVAQIITIGEPLTTAVSELGAAQFSCGGIKPTQCGKQVGGCMETVEVYNDSNYLVKDFRVLGVRCLYTP